jgi:hypothetical protein
MPEPIITINGVQLNTAQAMTMRVALTNFVIDLKEPDALGNDETGIAIRNGYRARLNEIFNLILKK